MQGHIESFAAAQQDMRDAYFLGIPGLVSSGVVWLSAGLVTFWAGFVAGAATLIVAGTFIFPVSVVLSKALGRRGKHKKGNPLGPLALEGTLWMLLSFPLAIMAAFHRWELFFPAMMLVIGGRYLTFHSLYGMRVYWLCGGALAVAALGLLALNAPAYIAALTSGAVEMAFALIIYWRSQLAPRSYA